MHQGCARGSWTIVSFTTLICWPSATPYSGQQYTDTYKPVKTVKLIRITQHTFICILLQLAQIQAGLPVAVILSTYSFPQQYLHVGFPLHSRVLL